MTSELHRAELELEMARNAMDSSTFNGRNRTDAAHAKVKLLRARADLRSEIVNSPETADFMEAVPLEAAHQRDRWGAEHDAGKSPFDWFWLIGYLAQKAADAAVRGDTDKALHHTISTAAALANWHGALSGKSSSTRPGIAGSPHNQEAAPE